MRDSVSDLRRRLAQIVRPQGSRAQDLFATGVPEIDHLLCGGFERARLHEIYAAAEADAGTAAGFAAALAQRASGQGRGIVWVRQAFCDREAGSLSATGLAEIGVDPQRLVLVRAGKALDVLKAGVEAARCGALGAIILETWGEPKALDFTATRRLALAAEKSGATLLMIRLAAEARPSAAATRWQVAGSLSRGLETQSPGLPAFEITLLRHRADNAGRSFRVEWNRDEHIFREISTLSRPVVSLPAGRPVAEVVPFARTG